MNRNLELKRHFTVRPAGHYEIENFAKGKTIDNLFVYKDEAVINFKDGSSIELDFEYEYKKDFEEIFEMGRKKGYKQGKACKQRLAYK